MCAGEPGPQVVGAGHDQRPGLVDGLGPLGAGAALGDHQRADRLDGAVPALRRAAGPAGLGGPGGADGVQRVGLALPAPVLPVGAVDLDDPDAGRGDVAGQAGAVAAGALDPDQGRRSRTRPASSAGGRTRPRWPGTPATPSSPPTGSSAAATCTSAWVSTPPVIARVSTMVTAIPFLWLRDGTHPLAAGPVNPGLLPRPGRSGPAPPVGAMKTWDPADRSSRKTTRAASADSEVRPGPRLPTLRPYSRQNQGSRAGSTIHILPADSALMRATALVSRGQRRSPCSVRPVEFRPGLPLANRAPHSPRRGTPGQP